VSFTDKLLACSDCGRAFTFTAGEQEFHQSKGFTTEPRRCPDCRAARKGSEANGPRGSRELFTVTCASCGKPANVPFQPRGDRPVYCSDCFQRQPRNVSTFSGAGSRSGGFGGGRPDSRGGGYGAGGGGSSDGYGRASGFSRDGRSPRGQRSRSGSGSGRSW